MTIFPGADVTDTGDEPDFGEAHADELMRTLPAFSPGSQRASLDTNAYGPPRQLSSRELKDIEIAMRLLGNPAPPPRKCDRVCTNDMSELCPSLSHQTIHETDCSEDVQGIADDAIPLEQLRVQHAP